MPERRHDPRVDPLSMPPGGAARDDHDADSERRGDPRADPLSSPQVRQALEPLIVERVAISTIIAERSRTDPPPEGKHGRVLIADPRIDSLDRKIAANDWTGITSELGSLDDVGRLPPNLGLAAALAHHELATEGNQDAIAIGVRCMAALLGVGETSQMAGLIGRRLFRKNPVRRAEAPAAPPPRVSVPWIVFALVVGAVVGWLAGGGLAVVRAIAGPR